MQVKLNKVTRGPLPLTHRESRREAGVLFFFFWLFKLFLFVSEANFFFIIIIIFFFISHVPNFTSMCLPVISLPSNQTNSEPQGQGSHPLAT